MKLIIPIFFILNYIFTMSGLELANLMDSRSKPLDIKSLNTMTLTNKKDKKKVLELISMSKDDSKKQMIWFLKPRKDKGIAFLKLEKEDEDDFMTMWLPGFSRFKRIKSSQKSDSFMGSDLSFEDMLSRDLDEFNYNILESDDTLYVLESICNTEDSEYSRHVSWITKDNLLIKKEHSYDKNEKLLKKKSFKHILIDNYHVVSEIDVINVQEQHQTILTIKTLELDTDIADDTFQEKNLKRFEKFIK